MYMISLGSVQFIRWLDPFDLDQLHCSNLLAKIPAVIARIDAGCIIRQSHGHTFSISLNSLD